MTPPGRYKNISSTSIHSQKQSLCVDSTPGISIYTGYTLHGYIELVNGKNIT